VTLIYVPLGLISFHLVRFHFTPFAFVSLRSLSFACAPWLVLQFEAEAAAAALATAIADAADLKEVHTIIRIRGSFVC
jgi:hypothetical protein